MPPSLAAIHCSSAFRSALPPNTPHPLAQWLRLGLGLGLGLRLRLRLGLGFAGAARTKEAAQLAAHARLLVDLVGEHGREAEVPRREEPLAPARGHEACEGSMGELTRGLPPLPVCYLPYPWVTSAPEGRCPRRARNLTLTITLT